MDPIHLDHNATTPLDPEVLEAMRPYWLAGGNAESRHFAGRAARRALIEATEQIALVLGADPTEVVITSGGTEADNLALFGLAGKGPGQVVASPIEHPAVSEPLARLEEGRGFTVNRPEVGTDGVMDADEMADAIGPETRFATLILANNETGAIQPVQRLATLAAEHGVPVHTDAVQAVGRVPVHFHDLGVATLAASAHKFHGPLGVGLLLVRKGIKLAPHTLGGGQQGGRRPGTVPVPLVVGLAAALGRWQAEALERMTRWRTLRNRLETAILAGLGPEAVVRNGPDLDTARLPQTLNVGFPGLNGDALLMQLDLAGVAASLGSACASGTTQSSPTLLAMRVPADRLRASVRFSLGATTTETQIDEAARRIVAVVQRITPKTATHMKSI